MDWSVLPNPAHKRSVRVFRSRECARYQSTSSLRTAESSLCIQVPDQSGCYVDVQDTNANYLSERSGLQNHDM